MKIVLVGLWALLPQDDTVRLFNGKDLSGLTTWLKESQREDPKKVFKVHDGAPVSRCRH